MSRNFLRDTSEWALMVALVFGAGATAQAQEEEPQGPVIQIGKGDVEVPTPERLLAPGPTDGAIVDAPQLSKYWIGLGGSDISPDHVLRAHIDLPENQGLLVDSVQPNSPSAKAGLKRHDILLRGNDIDLHEMHDLVDLVSAEGEKKGQIALEVLRHGERETVYLTPEDRPADAQRPQGGEGGGFGGGFGGSFGGEGFGEGGMPQELLQQFRGRIPMEFRQFGPGVIVGGSGQGTMNIPKGVSVNILKDAGKPTRITVKRGDESWEVVGDDAESLEKLPEDLRPYVEQMLHGASPMDLHTGGTGKNLPGLPERLERMEKRLEEMSKRLGQENQPASESVPNDQSK